MFSHHEKHAEASGVWGHPPPPPGNVLKIDTKKLNLVAFQSIKITQFLGSKFKLETRYTVDDIWQSISTTTVIIPFVSKCIGMSQ